MEKFEKLKAVAAPMGIPNVDTDAIIPKQFLKSIKRSGFGPNLFDEWRYMDHGEPGMDNVGRPLNPNFVLNLPQYRGASVLLARKNFGCGSSREHAAWSLVDRGFRAVVAPSFARIFFENAYNNGIAPIVVDDAAIDALLAAPRLQIDLEAETVLAPDGATFGFTLDPLRKQFLFSGGYMAFLAAKRDAVRTWLQRRAKGQLVQET